MDEEEVGEACSMGGVEEKCNRVLVGKPEGKRPHVAHRHT
jgi:hypothetical protein